MVYFVGAGPGDPDLLTIRARRLLEQADTVIYAGSLVNRACLEVCPKNSRIFDSSSMTLDEIVREMTRPGTIVRLHTGDPALFGAIQEQISELDRAGVPWEIVPGVSSLFAGAAALGKEFTVPGVCQSLIVTRMPGRTPVPEWEAIKALSGKASFAFFLSVHRAGELMRELLDAGADPALPVAVVSRASWPDEKVVTGTLA